MSIDFTQILEYYKDRLITQYRAKTKMRGTVGVLVNNSVCDGLPLQFKTAFDLTSATGDQLDIIARIVGIPRDVLGLDLAHSFFSFTRYDSSASTGFSRYTDTFDFSTPIFLRYRTNASYVMTDFELRTAILLKIIYNNRYETYYDVKAALYNYFAGMIDVNKGASTMSIKYTVSNVYKNAVLSMLFLGLMPSPMGVAVSAVYI